MSEVCSGEQTFAQLRTGLRQQNISSQFNTGIGRKRKKAVKDDLMKNSKGGGGGGTHKQSEGLGGVLYHSPSYVTTSRCARSLLLKELSD